MEMYLIKSVACLGIFYAFYKIFLERENMHTIKRFYLLGTVLASFLIPLITFTKYIEAKTTYISVITSEFVTEIPAEIEVAPNYWAAVLWSIYGLGLLFFSLKFGRNLYSMIQKIRKNPLLKSDNIFHVLLKAPTTPHTFFSYIFLNKRKFEAQEIPEEVLFHEQAHAKEFHSMDVILMELLQIVFWFNPFLYLFKHSIKLNHEFLADRAVLNKGVETANYQTILLAFSSNASAPELANSINYSFIKKRFTVMKTSTSKRTIWLRSLFLLPLLTVLIYGFSSTEVKLKDLAHDSTEIAELKATPQEVAQYNKLASKWNEDFAKNNTKRIIQLEDLNVLESLYRKMSTTQKADAEPFPSCVPPPPPPIPADATAAQIAAYEVTIKEYEDRYNQKVVLEGTDLKATPKQKITFYVIEENIYVNGLLTKLEDLVEAFDNITEDWSKVDFELYGLDIKTDKVNQSFIEKINVAYKKTYLARQSNHKNSFFISPNNDRSNSAEGSYASIPSPSQPVAHINAMATKGASFYFRNLEISSEKALYLFKTNSNLSISTQLNDPMPPIVIILEKATKDQIKEYNKLAKKYNDMPQDNMRINGKEITRMRYLYDLMTIEQRKNAEPYPNIPPPPPPPPAPDAPPIEVIKGVNDGDPNIPPPPPPPAPEDPLDHIISMAKKGAAFYYEGKKISSDKAIELVKKNKDLNIQSTGHDSKKPVVKISKEPIQLRKSKSVAFETGNTRSLGGNEQLFYVKMDDKVTYYNSYGSTTDVQGNSIPNKNKSPFVYNGQRISPQKANELLQKNKKLAPSAQKNKDGHYTIVLNSHTNNASKSNYNINNNTNNINKNNIGNVNKNNIGNVNPNSEIGITEALKRDATFYYNDKIISTKEAMTLIEDPTAIARVHNVERKNGKPSVYLYSNLSSGATSNLNANMSGPQQNPTLVFRNLIESGDTFYLLDKEISKKEALRLFKENPIIQVKSVNNGDGTSKVYLNDKGC